MIAHVRGRILEKQPTRLVVEMGGMGLEILVPLPVSRAAGEVGDEVSLHTNLVVREDSLTLYGFLGPEDRAMFLKLIGVTGIGPKIALNALSGISREQLAGAIRDQDLAVLTRLPGIGKKTAERISLELKDAMTEFEGTPQQRRKARPASDAVAALVSLGYSRPAAAAAVERVNREQGDDTDLEALIRGALGRLAGGRG